jgi:hypothetical protein
MPLQVFFGETTPILDIGSLPITEGLLTRIKRIDSENGYRLYWNGGPFFKEGLCSSSFVSSLIWWPS